MKEVDETVSAMSWKLLFTLVAGVGCGVVDIDFWRPIRNDLLDAVNFIAERYFEGHCLCFFYPRKPPPDLVFSNLLIGLYRRWTPIVPSKNLFPDEIYPSTEDGVTNFIKCSFVIPIRNENYTSQIEKLLYHSWNSWYLDGGSPYTRFIVVVDGEISKERAYDALKTMFVHGDIDVVFVALEEDVVSVFTLFPYGRDGGSCPEDNTALTRLAQWNGKFEDGVDFYPNKVPVVFKGCNFRVSAVNYAPFLYSIGDNKYDGIDYRMVRNIAKKWNTTLSIIFYNRIDGWVWQDEKSNFHGSLNDLREGLVWATCSGVSNNQLHYRISHTKTQYVYSRLVWYFSNPLPIQNWKFVYLAFSDTLWISGILTSLLTPLSFYLLAKVTRQESYLKELEKCCFTLWSISFGNSTGFLPRTSFFRLLYSLWLFYTIHINLAYTASLTGLITGGKMEAKVKTIDDIIERNLPTGMFAYLVKPLFKMIDEPKVRKAILNYIIVSNYTDTFEALTKYRNLSIVDNDVFIDNIIILKKLPIYQTRVKLFSVPMGIMVRRNHYIYDRLDQLVQRSVSAGINVKLINDYTVSLWKYEDKKDWKAVDKNALAGPFILYGCGCVISCFTFLVEIIYNYSKNRNINAH